VTLGARWIRLGTVKPRELIGALAGLAAAQGARALPVLVWARAAADVDTELVCAGEGRFVFALLLPRLRAPGRAGRWKWLVLGPAVATYRQLGEPAYASGAELWLGGARIARASACAIGECVVASCSFLPRIPRAGFEERVIEAALRARLEAQHGWQFDHSWASAAERAAIAGASAEPALVR
jgi:hypothetical protein